MDTNGRKYCKCGDRKPGSELEADGLSKS